MSKGFYTRLAVTNIRKNSKTYFPYILASSATVMMFYNLLYLLLSKDVNSMHDSSTLSAVLGLGSIVTGIFAFILLLYINSFLIKRRKKEFGLFNILGMEKKHIARIMLLETVMIGLLCIGLGLIAGVLFSKLALLLLLKILAMNASFGFEVPLRAVSITVILFGAIFLINLVYNVFQVHVSKPIELLKGGNVGEKEPQTKWLIALTGAAALGGGYFIALTVKSPLAALNLFFVAVILVIIGTYCLFTAGSIAVLKALRRNKRFYYRTNPFIAVSGMIYRMKQNAAGLASICILATMVIVMVSSTVSLYIGLEDALRTNYIREISVSASDTTPDDIKQVDDAIAETVKIRGLSIHNPIRLRYASEAAIQDGNAFTGIRSAGFSSSGLSMLMFITAEEYHRIEGVSVELSEGEALVYIVKGKLPGETLDFGGYSLNIRGRLDKMETIEEFSPLKNSMLAQSHVIVTADEQDLNRARQALNEGEEWLPGFQYNYLFDTKADRKAQADLVSSLQYVMRDLSVHVFVEGREASKNEFISLYGVLFFLGLFLGALFILGTVLIIYYKQISEGYDDKERFAIMAKVGLSRGEIKKTIRFQVLSVFFLPLIMAVIHIAAAFPVICKLLTIFNMTNVPLYAICTALTILVFAVCYAMIYSLTARTYYRIVR
ncbi:ABC-type antimicrobial peptide transport system, permease component [Thermobacillus composti KWC4]|uniref:ABC-type antimicrobial peptide transport system, permease component n=1 Tax=Thermobacillus composti (strain DSM 18247 / JCM 13945 / KWC4) TaxID=717605 RepID=L0EIL4_THECK|nr:ABC transporter permease [Thermobacillus composti]AGA59459.1 ABC-type antimicrobial peptide transport system, permease component [Thermobacillus composti KWC4]